MEPYYVLLFGVAAVLAGGLEYGNRMAKGATQATSTDFVRFKNNYLVVYSLMMGEWRWRLNCSWAARLPTHVSTSASWTVAMRGSPWGLVGHRSPNGGSALTLVGLYHQAPRRLIPTLRRALPLQLATGCRARMCMPCTSTMASRSATSAASSSRALGRP